MITNCCGRAASGNSLSDGASTPGKSSPACGPMGRRALAEVEIVADDQTAAPQRLVDDSGRVERVESLADMLKQQDIRTIVDAGNRITKTMRLRAKAAITSRREVGRRLLRVGHVNRATFAERKATI